MKVCLNTKQVRWMYDNLLDYCDLDNVIVIGSLMDKYHIGQSAFYVDVDFLRYIVELAVKYSKCSGPYFFSICSVLQNNVKRNTPMTKKYCIRFDSTGPNKIPSIKALRDLFRNQSFITMFNYEFPSGLREVKDMVENGWAIGPYDNKTVNNVKWMINGNTFEVVPYQKGMKVVTEDQAIFS